MLLRLVWRLLSMPVLVLALVFLVALGVDLSRQGGLEALPSSVPAAARFTADYVRGLGHAEVGTKLSPHRGGAPGVPLAAELRRALPRSLGLLAVALALAAVVGLTLGVAAAYARGSCLSGLLLFSSVLGTSTPSFFAAMLLMWLAVWVYRTTGVHAIPIAGFGWDAHLILPALVLAARPAATVTRLSCSALVEILEADYVRTAVAKGLSPDVLILRHVLRNAGVPLLTTVGVSLRFSLAVLPIVEYMFNWPGIGLRLLEGIQTQDANTAIGMALPLVMLFVLMNLLLEILCPLVDPRLRAAEAIAA